MTPAGPQTWTLVETDATLASFCHAVEAWPTIAIDTEFVGERTYYPRLEVIQLCTPKGETAIIDTSGIRDFTPLTRVLCDPARMKILHAGGQDIPLLERLLGSAPLPVFDTQLAAAMAGLGPQVSLTNLVRELLGIELDGGQTVSDWTVRPLTQAQLEYAAEDVFHLHRLHEELQKKLRSLGRLEWFAEEQNSRANESIEEDLPDHERYLAVKEWGKLSGIRLAVLRELAAWREREARTTDTPRRTVLGDPALIALARATPTKRDQLKNLRNAPPSQIYRHADKVLQVIEEALRLPRERWPQKQRTTIPDIPTGFVELLQAVVRCVGDREKIAPQLLATTADLNALVNNRHRLQELDIPLLNGWRRAMIGQTLIELLGGDLSLHIKGREELVFEHRPGSN